MAGAGPATCSSPLRPPGAAGALLAALCGGAGTAAAVAQASGPRAPLGQTFALAPGGASGGAAAVPRAVALGAAAAAVGPRAAGAAAVQASQAAGTSAAAGVVAACLGAGALVAGGPRPRVSTAGGLRRSGSKILVKAFENELGVQPPLGYFDPLGLSRDSDFDEFYRRREAELKNGRVAMYATLGYILPEYFRWPGYLSPTDDITFADVPNGLAALSKVPLEGWLQIIAWCGFYEIVVNQPKHPSEPGNYYKGRLAVFWYTKISVPEMRTRSLNSELANGRLAMMAITGMMIQNGLVGNTGHDMWFP